MTYPLNGIAPLSHLGVIRVEGEDAAKFLHGQLTQDFALLDLQHARLAAFLSAKGRMQASFIGFKRSETEVLLVCSRDLLAPTLKRLSMFVPGKMNAARLFGGKRPGKCYEIAIWNPSPPLCPTTT